MVDHRASSYLFLLNALVLTWRSKIMDKAMHTSTASVEDPTLPLERKIAIVGIGCRYANGINNVDDFVRMLRSGTDCTSEPPEDRYDTKHLFRPGKSAGKMYNKKGGYVKHNMEAFDRQFFKMPPEEANALDPQVRLLLETTWEGLEDAGIPTSKLKGTNTGVYMGVTASEYNSLSTYPYENISQYTNSGTNSCMVANRISYELDLRGPSFSVDTACSSSLYTIHLACEALRHGDCDAAVAGGVNLLLSPITHIGFCQAGMLAPDGCCKSFDNSADGYSRSEGAGVVVLKPLVKALEDGDDIYCVIRGGALSNDGHTPGIANPSYEAQVDLVYRACAHAKADPHKIEYIEAHGTGTKVGDKTEANALGEALGKDRKQQTDPDLYIGSVKSNIGHTEGAAGVAGVIKVAVMQRYNFIPPVVHFKKGNENISFNELNLRVPTGVVEWPRPVGGQKRLAGCSSFGFGGANAHLVMEEPPARNHASICNQEEKKTILFMSAASKVALEVRKRQFSSFLDKISEEKLAKFVDVAASSYYRSHHHRQRLAIVAQNTSQAKEKLAGLIDGGKVEAIIDGTASEKNNLSGIVFVFTGMGSQWWAMGRRLCEENATFKTTIQSFDEVMKSLGADWMMTDLLTNTEEKDKINNTAFAQPAICALEMGLVHVLRQYGIKPDVIVGHSVGEVAAAYASGMLSFEDAVKVIYHRGKELCKTSGNGKMLAVLHPCEDVITRLEASGLKEKIDVAAMNSPTQIVLSGDSDAVDQFAEKMKGDGIRAVMLKVNNAFHSFQQEVLKTSLLEKFSFLTPESNGGEYIPMVSTVTGEFVSHSQLNSSQYWWSNVRQGVSFKPAIERLLKEGYSTFLEIGAHPAMSPAILDIIRDQPEQPSKILVMGTLKRPRDISHPADDQTLMLAALAKLHCEGYSVNFHPLYPEVYQAVAMPLYPWQRMECSSITKEARETFLFPRKYHNILGRKEDPSPVKPSNVHIWNSELTIETVPWIMDHIIQDSVIAPGTSYLETALQSARELHGDLPLTVCNVELKKFLFMPDCKATLQIVVDQRDEDTTFSIYSKGGKNTWSRHATGNIELPAMPQDLPVVDVEDIKAKLSRPEACDTDYLYAKFSCMGYALGPSFKGMKKAWFNEDLTSCYTVVTATNDIMKERDIYNFHPAMMDALMQGFGDTLVLRQEKQAEELKIKFNVNLYVPLRVKKIQLLAPVPETVYVHSHISEVNGEMHADINVADEFGKLCYRMVGLVFGRASDSEDGSDLQLWTFHWENLPLPSMEEDELSGKEEENPRNLVDVLVVAQDKDSGCFIKEHIQNGMKVAMETLPVKKDSLMDTYPDVQHVVFTALATELPSKKALCEKDTFLSMLDNTCIAASDIGQQISDMARPGKPTFWIITRGAQVVDGDSFGNPMGHTTQAVAVGLMNEVPDVHTMMVDLPVENDMYEKCLPVLKQLVQTCVNTENELCIRYKKEGVALYGRRLQHRAPASISQPINHTKWALKENAKSKGMSLVPVTKPLPNPAADQLVVNIQAFKVIPSSSASGFTAMVAGSVKGQGQTVVGFTKSAIQSTMILDKCHVGDIPSGMESSAAIGFVDLYLLPFVVNGTSDLSGKNVAIYGKSKAETSAFQQILSSSGCKVRILASPQEVLPKNDVLVIFVDQMTKAANVKNMLKSLKPFGKVISVLDGESISPAVTKVLSQDKFTSCMIIHRALDDEDPIGRNLSSFIPALLNKVTQMDGIKLENARITALADAADTEGSLDIITDDGRDINGKLDVKGNAFKANPKATYLVTGASKGFGLEVLQWLHDSGARHIVVLSRSQPQGEDMTRLTQMEGEGISVAWRAVDITCAEHVDATLTELQQSHPPIEGIIHCAAAYRDGWMKGLADKDWHDVMLPKAYGAYILHQVSLQRQLPLKHFVLFSSVVNLLGSAGQANYCAANGFLYALGEMRRCQGLPATVASFGVINTVGFAARNDLVETWEDKGMSSVSPPMALNTLGMMLTHDIFHLGITGFFETKMYYAHNRPQLNEHLQLQEGCYSRWKLVFTNNLLQQNKKGLGQTITEETPSTAKEIIRNELTGFLAEQLGIADPESITLDNPPTAYGLDSLMSSDMSNYISEKFQTAVLPVELLNDKNTIGKLVNLIYEKIMAKGSTKSNESQDNVSSGPVLVMEDKVDDPSAVLVCFPPNGGGLSTFNGWQEKLKAKKVQVHVVSLPGWEGQEEYKPLGDFNAIIASLTEKIAPIVNQKKFTFYGHSFGAILAYEVSHMLKAKHGLCPQHLYLAAWYGPKVTFVRPEEATHKMFEPDTPIEEAIKQARCFRFLDEDVLQNVNVMRRMLPCIKVSLDMCEQYKYRHAQALPASLHIYSGSKDAFVPEMVIREWDKVQHPEHGFQFKVFEGGKHLFMLDVTIREKIIADILDGMNL